MGVYAFLTTAFAAGFGPSRRFALPFQSRLKPDMVQWTGRLSPRCSVVGVKVVVFVVGLVVDFDVRRDWLQGV